MLERSWGRGGRNLTCFEIFPFPPLLSKLRSRTHRSLPGYLAKFGLCDVKYDLTVFFIAVDKAVCKELRLTRENKHFRPRVHMSKKSPRFMQICIPKRDYLPENQVIWQIFSSMCTGPLRKFF